ncbi:hypothetical protein DXG03_000766 [Asterophora parasitica]|uniref:Uncharacterized protein n=1 Tax=Asterophora parasitica TaxID=117018 RepID=A0A9P7KCS8_9AGAR|nr:hypothetical protein DXG03_000766 [Asterophora parasitica]
MPLIGRTHRLPHTFSSRKLAPGRQPKSSRVTTNKISHRFVRIHRKSKAYSRESSRRQKYVAADSYADRDDRHRHILGYNRHLGEVTAIPNPTPDTGLKPTTTPSFSTTAPPVHQSVHSVPLSKTGLPSPTSTPTSAPTFSTLPPLLSLDPNSSSAPSQTAAPSTSAYEGPEPTMVSAAESQRPSQPHKLSIPIIVLLAVSSGVLLIGLFTLIKYYSRPRRRHFPTPSRPILDDPFADFADAKFPPVEDPDSPIFGGKERISGANGALWSWSQYPRPTISVTKPEDNGPSEPASNGSGIIKAHPPHLQGSRNSKAVSGHGHSHSVPITSGDSPYYASLQQVKGAMSRVANRISMASVSMYPSSPQSAFSNSNVGLAITRSPMTGDGSNVLKRTEPKAALDRTRNTLAASEAAKGTISASLTMDRYSDSSAYDGSELGSPSVLPYAATPANPPPTYGGRSRIKSSYYTPGSYPRVSDAHVLNGTNGNNKISGDSRVGYTAKKDRDTQALTYALGLHSPATDYGGASTMPPSPQPTLYPEDSMSRRPSLRKPLPAGGGGGGHGKKKSEGRGHPSLPVISHAMDASAALGSLMLLDFNGQATRVDNGGTSNASNVVTTTTGAGNNNTGSISKSGRRMSQTVLSRPAEVGGAGARVVAPLRRNGSGRSDDKPPSIPLPELGLPSLTQMGLEHANPQAYADYRSPTYSIFGLYGDRKSGIGG